MNIRTILIGVVVVIAAVVSTLSMGSSTFVPAKTALPVPQATPEKPLNQAAVDSWIAELKRNLPDFISDEDDVDTIAERWRSRKDLVGKTPSQLLSLLFQDVTVVVDDAKVSNKIWLNWELRYKGLKEKAPSASGARSEPECFGSKTEKGTVKWFNIDRGYGYITRADGTEIFVHYTAIMATGSAQTLKEGDKVRFVVVNGPKSLNAKCVAKTSK